MAFSTMMRKQASAAAQQQRRGAPAAPARVSRKAMRVSAAASADTNKALGFKMMRDGVKEAAEDTLLTPRL